MTYFPMFLKLENAPCLVAGGGAVALRKVKTLLSFGAEITLVAPDIDPELEKLPQVHLVKRCFCSQDLDGMTLAVAATDNGEVNREIARLCRARQIPVNVADQPEVGTFVFPAVVQKGSLTIGVSTGGASPAAAVFVKEKIASVLPGEDKHFQEILDYLAKMRPVVKQEVAESHRKALFLRLFDLCMEKNRPLTQDEWEALRQEGKMP